MNRNSWNKINKNMSEIKDISSIIKGLGDCKIEDEEVEVILEKKEEKKFVPFVYKKFEANTLSSFGEFKNEVQKASNLYSRFCNNIIEEGVCKHNNCTFAHTVEQYSPMKCRFNCQNRRCQYYHSWENVEEYIQRNNISVHEHIRMQSVMEKSKINVTNDLQKSQDNPHFAQLNLLCSLSQMTNEVTKLNKLGYSNFNIKIKENTKTKISVDNTQHYISFLNENIHNFTFDKLDSFITKEKYRLSFTFNPNGFFCIRNLIVNKDERLINKIIQERVSGLELINKIHECVSDKIKKSYNLRQIKVIEEKGSIEMDVVVDEF